MSNNLVRKERDLLIQLKHKDDKKQDFWLGRDLMGLFGYAKWENFVNVIQKAVEQTRLSGRNPEQHFIFFEEQIAQPKGGYQKRQNCILTEYGAWATTENADPTNKPIVATAKDFFLEETKKYQVIKDMELQEKRIDKRDTSTAKDKFATGLMYDHGVRTGKKIAYVKNQGYIGLTTMDAKQLREHWGVPNGKYIPLVDIAPQLFLSSKGLMDEMAGIKIDREETFGTEKIASTFNEIGEGIRDLCKKHLGVTPEELPPQTNIKQIKSEYKKGKKFLSKKEKEEQKALEVKKQLN
jgi:DNA-damage-inducible protein D